VVIEVVNKQRLIRINRRAVFNLAQATLEAIEQVEDKPYADAQLTIVFVRDKKIQELNRLYRGKDYATDVLSFQTIVEKTDANDFTQENYLGDIVISTDTAWRQAADAKLAVEREIQELVMHGVLHLCGYDHETDHGEMNRLELKLRKKLLK
jgi:probable rRNA maturation factor